MTDIALADEIRALPAARDLIPGDRQLLPAPMAALQEVAAMLAAAGALVPKDLRGKPDVCLAVAYMAALHGTDPVATASQTYLVGDKIAFMAQYINALVQRHFAERPTYTYQGAGATRCVMVSAKLKSGQVVSVTTPQVGQITVKNSPLWKTDPDQQLSYYSIRALARRHMPDVLLGIYAVEELQSVSIRDITPPPPDPFREDDDSVDAPVEDAVFEPSGGFVTEERDFPGAEPTSTEDDILAWAEGLKEDARKAADRAALQALWDGCYANRRKLWTEERIAHESLLDVFKDAALDLTS